ncbi:MAG: MFS transporter [Brevundimonas sp.]|uniref:spinster family MFS transporter n=1 Tax=Brevundimonas sp. TaxID=1871086 RepID=UPI0025BA5AF2|nr:MFS transporter [Brevundimonas sp.]MBX3477734.1 MFS transporter [Brevundimonas sp.]
MQISDTTPAMPGTPRPPLIARPGYVLFLLMLGYVLSFFDRQILVVLIEPVSRDLNLTDTHFGLLYGFAFALFYTVMGLFFGRLVDRFNRPRLLAICILLWSAATAACGLADTFGQLFVARMMVGVGEAALAPVAYSLIADLFEPRRRARAFSVYATGIYLGTGTAFLLGGRLVAYLDGFPNITLPLVGDVHGWQAAFLVAGVPGIFLALALLFVRDPRGRAAADTAAEVAAQSSFKAFFAHAAARWRALACHHLGFALHTGFGYAIASWTAAFYLRVHQWSIADIGLTMGLLLLTAGPAGALSGGALADAMLKRGISDAYLRLGSWINLAQIASVALLVLSPNPFVGLIGLALAIATMSMTGGPAGAALQLVTPARLRGQAGAFYTFVSNILGLSLVPLLVALCTDHLFGDPRMVGVSLLLVGTVVLSIAAALLWIGKSAFRVEAA